MGNLQQPVIKICGLSDASSAQVAVNSGATALGFMFAKSRRRVAPNVVVAILGELPDRRPPAVGVTVNLSPIEILKIVSTAGIDIVQLSGDESVDILGSLDVPVWKAFRFADGATLEAARREIDPWISNSKPVDAILVDAADAGGYGGTGHRANWVLAAQLAQYYPLILAGGLDPDNVGGAIGQVRPMGVDVSTGVELHGSKDPDRIESFVKSSNLALNSMG